MRKEWIEYTIMVFGLAVTLVALCTVIWFVCQLVCAFRVAFGGVV